MNSDGSLGLCSAILPSYQRTQEAFMLWHNPLSHDGTPIHKKDENMMFQFYAI